MIKINTIISLIIILFAVQLTVFATERKDTTGPVVRLTKFEKSGNNICIEGYASDSENIINKINYILAVRDINVCPIGNYKEISPADGKFDGRIENFSLIIPVPEHDRTLFITIFDEAKNSSVIKICIHKRGEKVSYITYLSKSALNFNYKDYEDIFRIYYSSDIDGYALTEVIKKMSLLKKMSDENIGFKFKYYKKICILLYNPTKDEEVTFSEYRGVIEEDIFTFPFPVKTIEIVKNYNWVLDEWIPHELADHSMRIYFFKQL